MEPLLVVLSCSSSSHDTALRDDLEKQLQSLVRQHVIRLWHAGHVRAGEATYEVTLKKIREARIFLALISPDYLASEEHEHELKTALARSAELRVLPVMLRSCTLHGTPLAPMKLLPEGGTPVSKWTLADDAWASVARAVRTAVDEIRAGKGHHVPLDVARTAPMSPAAAWLPPPVAPSLPSTPYPSHPGRVSFVPEPPVASSFRPFAALPEPSAPVAPAPPPSPVASGDPKGKGGALRATGLLLGGALLATLGWRGYSLRADPSWVPPPVVLTARPEPTTSRPAAAPSTAKEGVCCGGLDCPESERRVAGSWCEQFPAYCSKCPSGRRRVDGACADLLSRVRTYRLRPGQALIGRNNAPADATVCFRRSGTVEPATCTTVNEARAGKAPAHPFPISIEALTAGPGVDFWIEDGGATLASETGAMVKGNGLKTGALCVGVVLQGPSANGDSVTVFLDDP